MQKNKYNISGFSLIELIIAITLFALGTSAILNLVMNSYDNNLTSRDMSASLELAEQGLEAVRSIRDTNFLDLEIGQHGLSTTNNKWEFSGSGNTIDDYYYRYLVVEEVYRDPNGNIVTAGALPDPDTFKVKSVVEWTQDGIADSVEVYQYLSNYRGQDVIDTLTTDFVQGTFEGTAVKETTPPPTDNGAIQLQENSIAGQFYANLDFDFYLKAIDIALNYLGSGQNILFGGTYGNGGGITAANVTSPTYPFGLSHLTINKHVCAIDVQGNYAYLGTNDTSKGLSIVQTNTIPQSPCPSNMKSYYQFEDFENLGDDFTGNNNGTVNGPEWQEYGRIGSAIELAEVDPEEDPHYIDLGDFNISGNKLTLSAWIKADSFAKNPNVISKANGSATQNHYWTLGFTSAANDEARIKFLLKKTNGTTYVLESDAMDIAEQWVHIVGRYDGQHMTIFANGVQVGQTSLSGNMKLDSNIPVWIGLTPQSMTEPFEGLIDEVAIFKRALTDQEIIAMYNSNELGIGLCETLAGGGSPSGMVELSEGDIGGKGNGIVVENNLAYMATGDPNKGLAIVNVAVPTSPNLIYQYDIIGQGKDILKIGDYIYIASPDQRKIVVINVSNPVSPYLVTSRNHDKRIDYLATSYNYLYAVEDKKKLLVYDISDLTNPIYLNEVTLSYNINDLTVLDNYAYLTTDDDSNGLAVVNVAYPPTPYLVTYVDVGAKGEAIEAVGDYVYMSVHNQTDGGLMSIHGTTDDGYATNGFYVSQIYDTGSPDAILNTIDWIEEIAPSSDVKLQIRTANSLAMIDLEPWVGSDGTSGTYYTEPRSKITVSPTTSGTQSFQYKVIMTGDGSSTPYVEKVKVNYTP